MASLKAVKPTGLEGQAKEPTKVSAAKGPAKLSATATKPAAAKGGIKKAESKPREPKKRQVKSSKPAAAKKLTTAAEEMELACYLHGAMNYI